MFFLITFLFGKSVYSIYESHCLFPMGRIYAHVVSPRARGKIILAMGNQNFSTGINWSQLPACVCVCVCVDDWVGVCICVCV